MRLEGKVVVVTAVGWASGASTCAAWSPRGRGWLVAVSTRPAPGPRRPRTPARRARRWPSTVDVADAASVARMVQATLDAWGQIDVLVNNAARFSVARPKAIEEISVEEWDRVMAVNVRGVFLCCQAVIPHLRQRGKGKIVNVASGVVLSAPSKFTHYVASKGAVFAFTRALATEVGKAGITVNSLAPGLVATPAVRQQVPDSGPPPARPARAPGDEDTRGPGGPAGLPGLGRQRLRHRPDAAGERRRPVLVRGPRSSGSLAPSRALARRNLSGRFPARA